MSSSSKHSVDEPWLDWIDSCINSIFNNLKQCKTDEERVRDHISIIPIPDSVKLKMIHSRENYWNETGRDQLLTLLRQVSLDKIHLKDLRRRKVDDLLLIDAEYEKNSKKRLWLKAVAAESFGNKMEAKTLYAQVLFATPVNDINIIAGLQLMRLEIEENEKKEEKKEEKKSSDSWGKVVVDIAKIMEGGKSNLILFLQKEVLFVSCLSLNPDESNKVFIQILDKFIDLYSSDHKFRGELYALKLKLILDTPSMKIFFSDFIHTIYANQHSLSLEEKHNQLDPILNWLQSELYFKDSLKTIFNEICKHITVSILEEDKETKDEKKEIDDKTTPPYIDDDTLSYARWFYMFQLRLSHTLLAREDLSEELREQLGAHIQALFVLMYEISIQHLNKEKQQERSEFFRKHILSDMSNESNLFKLALNEANLSIEDKHIDNANMWYEFACYLRNKTPKFFSTIDSLKKEIAKINKEGYEEDTKEEKKEEKKESYQPALFKKPNSLSDIDNIIDSYSSLKTTTVIQSKEFIDALLACLPNIIKLSPPPKVTAGDIREHTLNKIFAALQKAIDTLDGDYYKNAVISIRESVYALHSSNHALINTIRTSCEKMISNSANKKGYLPS